jgi:hypothetical protein
MINTEYRPLCLDLGLSWVFLASSPPFFAVEGLHLLLRLNQNSMCREHHLLVLSIPPGRFG